MPREKNLFDTIETQARHVIKLIEDEMADVRSRLATLQDQHRRWMAVLDASPPSRETRRTSGTGRVAGESKPSAPRASRVARLVTSQVDWDNVLKDLPDRFSMIDLERVTPTVGEKARARIVAIARWSKAKLVKKIGPGLYEKVTERARKRAPVAARLESAAPNATVEEEGRADEVRLGVDPDPPTTGPSAAASDATT